MAENVTDVTDQDFEDVVLHSEVPVVVDFWAPWCGPCHMVSPALEALAGENAGKIKVCKMNVDQSPQMATKYAITAIPSVFFFKDGQERSALRMVGARPKQEYARVIRQLLEEE